MPESDARSGWQLLILFGWWLLLLSSSLSVVVAFLLLLLLLLFLGGRGWEWVVVGVFYSRVPLTVTNGSLLVLGF